ncbi:hypothetical protein B0H16DRAFT_1509018 [Mycena metata]|uniref:RING-type domain-containing protein n=1 Tax=Mycena metata TaxID=1033252 RepID=A0AAD7NU12_9AGAR|nr:hypothetical protein B0H16DRAFT_1509018 [Mycena metata]
MGEVIDILSSPESSPRLVAKRLPLRGKGKARAKPDTIVLTDSEDEAKQPNFRARDARPAVAGPSRRAQPNPLHRLNNDASGSLENIPAKRRPKSKSVPLFLPSDEENEPPPEIPDLDLEEEAINVDNFPSPPPDPIPGYVQQILDVLPDALPDHVTNLVTETYPEAGGEVVQRVLHALFEDPSYPKVDKKGKRKRVDEDGDQGNARGQPKSKHDFGSKDREFKGGLHYEQLAMDQLMLDFPLIPKPHIRRTLFGHNSLYAPTHVSLEKEKRDGVLPYTPKTIPSRPPKGKRKALYDAEFEKEREWVTSHTHPKEAEVVVEEDDGACEDGIECGCCFATYTFEKMIQCPDAHLFCSSCVKQYAETLLGSHDHRICCMDQSGCKLAFPVAQLQRFLTPKLMSLYERVKQAKEVEAAGLEGLEECPFCEYKCVIENEQEKLFACRNEECGAVSCRQCKESDHLPKSCKEMEEDKKLDGRHTIEEAMTRALMRNCPRCQKPFIKDAGCNKMVCSNCQALSCYICRQLINGYDHFAQQPGQPIMAGSSKSNKCPLWDVGGSVENRHADEVKEAAERAREEYKRDHPDVDEDHLQVDLPVAPPAPAIPGMAHIQHNVHAAALHMQQVQAAMANNALQMQAAMADARGWVVAQMQYQAPQPPPPIPAAPPRRRRAAAPKRVWR